MESGILIVIVIIIIPLFYLFYFWANSEVLSEEEVKELSCSQRFWDLQKSLNFNDTHFDVNKTFKSALNKDGQFYTCNETLSNFPAVASALLKGKKHEWIIFAFAKETHVFSFYTNKGSNNISVAPKISPEYIAKVAKSNGSKYILQFHNHPNAVLSASQQDLSSAQYLGKIFNNNGINYLAFVCGTGRFYQYGWWIIGTFYCIKDYTQNIQSENGKSRSSNYELRRELRKKKYFKDYKLHRNTSHNILFSNSPDYLNNKISKSPQKNEMNYLQEVLSKFKEDLKEFPKPNALINDKMANMGDSKNETWKKYYYSLSQKELRIFDNMEMIEHSNNHKSFTFITNKFSINDLEHLVSEFYSILGDDMMGNGKFNDDDFNEIIDKKNWHGRMWTEYEKYNCAVLISIDIEAPKLDLCIKW